MSGTLVQLRVFVEYSLNIGGVSDIDLVL